MLSWAFTIHKVQGLSLEEGVVNFDLQKQRTFGQGQMYTALSRVSSYDKLFYVGKCEPPSIKMNVSALQEYERLRQNRIFENIEKIIVTDDSITILLLNVRSLSKHSCDIKSEDRLMSNDVLCFRETQLQHQHLPNDIEQYFENFRIFFNNNDNKFLSLAYAFQKDITVITQEDFAGVSICNFRKSSLVSVPLKLMILYKLNSQSLMTFCDYLYYFIEAKEVDIIVGDFNIDACSESGLPQILSEYVQLVEFPTHIRGSTLDHVYVKKSFLEDYKVEIVVLNTYFSDHDAVRVKISKKNIDFMIS